MEVLFIFSILAILALIINILVFKYLTVPPVLFLVLVSSFFICLIIYTFWVLITVNKIYAIFILPSICQIPLLYFLEYMFTMMGDVKKKSPFYNKSLLNNNLKKGDRSFIHVIVILVSLFQIFILYIVTIQASL